MHPAYMSKVMQVVMGDEHTFDCWVAYTHPNGKVTAIKPHLAAWVDIKSRMIIGDVMCKDANSDILKESLLKMLYHDAGSVPQYIYIDNGKDYTAKSMTGYDRNDRQRLEFDDATRGFYKSIGIEDYHRALPYYAWTKGQIERFFGTVCNQFTKWFSSYTGTLTGSRTFAKVEKDIDGMLERGELLTMEEFYEEWTKWLHDVYMVKQSGALKKQGEEYKTPLSCFENAEKYFKAVPPKSYATILMMKSERRFVRNVGVKLEGIRRWKRLAKKKKKREIPFNPEIDTGEVRPVRARVAVGDANDKYSTYPSNGLSPRRLARIFRAADDGDVYEQMEMFEEMEEKDTHLFSQLQTRKLAVTGLDWEVQPFSDEESDKQIAEFVTDQLRGLENLDDIFIDILDAIGKGISIMEIEWGVSADGHNIIENIEYVHPKKLMWNSTTDEMMICTKEYPSGVRLPENKFVVHKYKARSGHASRAGILRVVAWMYLFKNYDVKDWVAFCEVFGMPLRLGKYNAAASEEDKKALMEAIFSLGTDAAGIIPDSTIIDFVECNKTSSVKIYEDLARYCDEQMSKAVLGQTLSSDSGGGSYAQGKVHNEVRHDLTVADAKALSVTVRRDIIRPLVEYNFGVGTNIPFFGFDCQEAEDQKETVEILKTLVCDMGLKVPESHIYKKFNIPKPEEGEAVLVPRLVTETRMPHEPVEETDEQSLKDGTTEQEHIDQMADEAIKKSESSFREMMKPILKMVDQTEDLETLREHLEFLGFITAKILKSYILSIQELWLQKRPLLKAVLMDVPKC